MSTPEAPLLRAESSVREYRGAYAAHRHAHAQVLVGLRGTLVLRPPLILHDSPGDGFSARADAINNGKAALFGD